MGTEKRKVKYISRKRQEIPKETQIVTQFYQEAGKINYTIITRRVNFFNTKTARREVKYVEIRCLFSYHFSEFHSLYCNCFISVNCNVDCGTDDDVIPTFSTLPGSTGDEYHLVHISADELSDNSSTTPPPTVMTRKRSSPTGSNNSRESENSPTGSPG